VYFLVDQYYQLVYNRQDSILNKKIFSIDEENKTRTILPQADEGGVHVIVIEYSKGFVDDCVRVPRAIPMNKNIK